MYKLYQTIDRDGGGSAACPQKEDHLDLLPPIDAHFPCTGDRDEKDQRIGGDGECDVDDQYDPKIQAFAWDGWIPKGAWRATQADFEAQYRDVGDEEREDEVVYPSGELCIDGEDACEKEEKSNLREECGWLVDDGRNIQPLLLG